jgi:hypothetical protein
VVRGRSAIDHERVDQNVECLRCGALRYVRAEVAETGGHGECPRCGYLGWASPSSLSDSERRVLRLRPPERRHLYAI